MSAPLLLMTEISLSRNPGILASGGNPAEYAQADGKDNRSSTLID